MNRLIFSLLRPSHAARPFAFLMLAASVVVAGAATITLNGCLGGGCDPGIQLLDQGTGGGGGPVTGSNVGIGGTATGGAGGSASTGAPDAGDAGLCPALAGLDGVDGGDAGDRSDAASAPGCFPHTPGMICEGSDCKPICPAGDYEMTCTSADMDASIPAPDASLGCTIITIPTPEDALFYCCPCQP